MTEHSDSVVKPCTCSVTCPVQPYQPPISSFYFCPLLPPSPFYPIRSCFPLLLLLLRSFSLFIFHFSFKCLQSSPVYPSTSIPVSLPFSPSVRSSFAHSVSSACGRQSRRQSDRRDCIPCLVLHPVRPCSFSSSSLLSSTHPVFGVSDNHTGKVSEIQEKSHRKKSHGKKFTTLARNKKVTDKKVTRKC